MYPTEPGVPRGAVALVSEAAAPVGERRAVMFSSTVTDHWLPGPARPRSSADSLLVVVDDALPDNRRVQVLQLDGAGGILTLTSAVARELGLTDGAEIARSGLPGALADAGTELNGADHLFYFPVAEQETLTAEPRGVDVRRLTEADTALFEAFAAAAPEDDLDEAFVELDHWLVFGAFAGDRLVAAASMYPWTGTTLADLGVITLPEFRGQGHGRRVVRALSAAALEQGHEPQYRCQLDNDASVALARSARLARFGSWDVVKPEED